MFDGIMNGIDVMVDNVKEELLSIERQYQKTIIRTWIAGQSYSTSENRKLMHKKMKEAAVEELKGQTTTFTESFGASAKGKWVDKAKKVMVESVKNFDKLN